GRAQVDATSDWHRNRRPRLGRRAPPPARRAVDRTRSKAGRLRRQESPPPCRRKPTAASNEKPATRSPFPPALGITTPLREQRNTDRQRHRDINAPKHRQWRGRHGERRANVPLLLLDLVEVVEWHDRAPYFCRRGHREQWIREAGERDRRDVRDGYKRQGDAHRAGQP